MKDDRISFSFRIGAKGPLYTKEIERCFVRIEISKRESVIKKLDVLEYDALYTDILPFFVLVMQREEILAEKVRAVLTRNRARDVYGTDKKDGGVLGIGIKAVGDWKFCLYFSHDVLPSQSRSERPKLIRSL